MVIFNSYMSCFQVVFFVYLSFYEAALTPIMQCRLGKLKLHQVSDYRNPRTSCVQTRGPLGFFFLFKSIKKHKHLHLRQHFPSFAQNTLKQCSSYLVASSSSVVSSGDAASSPVRLLQPLLSLSPQDNKTHRLSK